MTLALNQWLQHCTFTTDQSESGQRAGLRRGKVRFFGNTKLTRLRCAGWAPKLLRLSEEPWDVKVTPRCYLHPVGSIFVDECSYSEHPPRTCGSGGGCYSTEPGIAFGRNTLTRAALIGASREFDYCISILGTLSLSDLISDIRNSTHVCYTDSSG